MKLFKKLISVALLAIPFFASAQECDIEIAIANITKGEVVPAAVNSRLEAKLTRALAKAGVIAAPYDSQFFIAGRFDDAFNDIIAGVSQKVVVKTTLTLYIGDADNQKVFASESFDLKGVGATDQQAYTNALNMISPTNSKLVDFIIKGKQKIIDYFDNNYATYINNARKAMASRDYGQALFYATSIPSCSRGYNEAVALALQINSDNLDYNGNQLLAKAQAAWAADPTESGAREAHKYLTQIDPNCSASSAAKSLSAEISKTTQKQWEFENVTKYKDQLALEHKRLDAETSLAHHRISSAASVERTRLRAARDVAVAWAKSRPRVVNRYTFVTRHHHHYY